MGEIDSSTRNAGLVVGGRSLPVGLPVGALPALVAALPRLTPSEADAFARDVALAREEMGEGRPPLG